MLIREILNEVHSLNENQMKKLVLMSGRFQPPHIGHIRSWQWLKNKFGDAYIVTSDKVDPPRSPFNFEEKKRLFVHAGLPANRIVKVKNPYRADEIVSKYDPNNTVLIFGVSEKDMDEDPRFTFAPKKDGSPSYLQPYEENKDNLKPLTQHGYVVTVPVFNFNVDGKPMTSATEFRKNFSQADGKTQARMITDLYGKYDKSIHDLMRSKITKIS